MAHRHLLEDPLVPGLPPTVTRVLAVGGDATRLDLMVKNLRLRGYYQVTSSNDPAAAVAGLRQGGVPSFDLVMVDSHSNYPGRGGAGELLEIAAGEPRLCVYAVPEKGEPIGPLDMKDLDMAKKPKKPRVVWTNELHKEFVEAHDKLLAAGEDAVPKKILHLMNNPMLRRENIASHL